MIVVVRKIYKNNNYCIYFNISNYDGSISLKYNKHLFLG